MLRYGVFGESHGAGVGIFIEGFPPGVEYDEEFIAREMRRRRPGGRFTSPRREEDRVEVLSGVFRGYTTGAPLVLFVKNRDVDSSFYERVVSRKPRPGHADYPARVKYHGYNDYRGGGMFSGRRTAALVAGGAVAQLFLRKLGVRVLSYVVQIGDARASVDPQSVDLDRLEERVYSSPFASPDPAIERAFEEEVVDALREGDSVGGVVETLVDGLPTGLGDPPTEGLDAELARGVLSIPGVKGFELGAGFALGGMRGSESNDPWVLREGRVELGGLRSGGVLGGLSAGRRIVFRAVFKPTSTIRRPQPTVDLVEMREDNIVGEGRHDPCIAIRGSAAVQAVTRLVLADHVLRWLSWEALPWMR